MVKASSIKISRCRYCRLLGLYDISVGMRCSVLASRMPMHQKRGSEEPGNTWLMKRAMLGREGHRVSLRITRNGSSGKRATGHSRLVIGFPLRGDRLGCCGSQHKGESEVLDRLDDVLQRLVSVTVLCSVIHGAEERVGILCTSKRSSRTFQGRGETAEFAGKQRHVVAAIPMLWTSCHSRKRRCTSRTRASVLTCQEDDLTYSAA